LPTIPPTPCDANIWQGNQYPTPRVCCAATDIKGIVDVEDVLQLGREIADRASHESIENGGGFKKIRINM
jgi:hypothetical protein